jgi:dTDP-4-amino-4,6-dideoxygalactose transaminase
LNSLFLTTGSYVEQFEKDFARYLNTKYITGVTSCTAALHLSLLVFNIGQGDEVITTPMSFCASSNSILHAGAKPVFVDVEEKTGNINADLIEGKITDKTKAILVVHLYGQMCDMKKIRKIADKYGLVVIEDAAHCVEGEREGIKVGELSNSACFSFYATKNLTSAEGGAVLIHDKEKADLLKSLRLHGMDKSAKDRYTDKYKHYDVPVLGWKYNMDNIHAALLIDQLKRLDDLWCKRKTIYEKYYRAFSEINEIELFQIKPDVKHAYHLFTLMVDEDIRDNVLSKLQKSGIGVSVNFLPIHLMTYYKKAFGFKPGDFPAAEKIGKRVITLPFYPKLTDEEINYVIDKMRNAVK